MPVKAPLLPISFRGGEAGLWRVTAMTCLTGAPLPEIAGLDVVPLHLPEGPELQQWVLRGTAGHVRYSDRAEVETLAARKADLGRPEARCAALIPIAKSDAWWLMAQDERRRIMEAESHHIAQSLKYLPAIARRLYHCRDLGEPFDFLTWFEFAPEHTGLFDELLSGLRATREWDFVSREVDIRLTRG